MDEADEVSRVFAALADPTRRDIVARLAVADATLVELAASYAVSVQAVAKHLKVLEDAGLVTRGREAQRRPAHLEAAVLGRATGWLERHRRQAEQRYARLDAVLAELAELGDDEPARREAPDRPRPPSPRGEPPSARTRPRRGREVGGTP
jgi:DNA-binding transcriptional ArsR family regulator